PPARAWPWAPVRARASRSRPPAPNPRSRTARRTRRRLRTSWIHCIGFTKRPRYSRQDVHWWRSARQGDVAVRLPDVAVGFPAPNRRDAAALGVLDVEFLGEPCADQLLHERLALGADGRELMRFPPHHEVAAAHVWQARFGALQLLERVLEGHARDRLEGRPRQARWRHAGRSALELAGPLDTKRRHAVAQVNL